MYLHYSDLCNPRILGCKTIKHDKRKSSVIIAVQLLFCEIRVSFILLAGMLVLEELQVNVEKYYASEVDDDAMNVCKLNFGDKVEYIGAVENLSQRKLHSLGRIDLLLGGSPCTELSLANPARKGLYGMYMSMYVISLVSILENSSSQWLPSYWCCSLNMGYKLVVNQQGYYTLAQILIHLHI